jgi:cell division protein FtsQ
MPRMTMQEETDRREARRGPLPSAERAVAARYPRSVSDRPSRWRLLLRRQRRRLRPAMLGLALLGCAAGVLLMARPDPARPPGRSGAAGAMPVAAWRMRLAALMPLRVQEIVTLGRANTPEGKLRAAIAVAPGQPILTVSVAETRARVEALPWVEHATVERQLPGTIVVQIEERRPFAIWQTQGKFLLIDRQGQVVTDEEVAAFRDLPLVVGQGAPEQAASLLDALAQLPALQQRVTAAVRVGARRWNLVLANDMQVLLPETAAPAALARLMELQADHDLLDRPLAVVDMRLPDRLVLRARADAPAGSGPAPALPAAMPPNAAAAGKRPA